ncbi:MAG: metallophosphoesterase [Parcubacteria group bacterium]|jgi:hypothetical protein
MKIAIISDIHENFHNIILALKRIEQEKCEQIIFLGDFMNNGVAKVLATSKIPVFAVWGNNDGDKSVITKTSLNPSSNLTVSDSIYDFLEFGGKRIFATHYPDIAKPMAKSGEYDAVFYGHNHLKNEEKIGNCLVVNPGEISAHKTGKATFAIYDTESNSIEFITLDNSITLLTDEVEDYLKQVDFEFSKSKRHQV